MTYVAVVLAGCGHRDGSEIREATFTLLALDQAEADVQFFAPQKEQMDVVDHFSGDTLEGGTRDVLVESARIARGDVRPLAEFEADEFDALIFPGGFGAAKNLSDYAAQGTNATVDPTVMAAVENMKAQGKPIGFICITPAAVAAPILGEKGVKLTAGAADDPAAQAITDFGAQHVPCATDNIVVDKEHRIVSTPAYMDGDARPREVFAGIEKLVQKVLEIVKTTEPELTV